MRLVCVGIDHKTAPVAVREKLAFDADSSSRALGDLHRRWPQAEFVIVSTCNRTEVYTARPVHAHPRGEQLRKWLVDFHGAGGELADVLYTLADSDAARHLFAVAAGLESLVPGENQIVAQLKDAYAAAVSAGAARPAMNELFQNAFHTAKHVRSETDVGRGKVSVASVAVDCVRRVLPSLDGKAVLAIGAGKMTALMLRHLKQTGAGDILVANRSAARAADTARDFGGRTVEFDALGQALRRADVVLCSTGSHRPLLTAAMVRLAQQERGFAPLLIVDIAVPRDVDATAGQVKNVSLYNIDDLEKIVDEALAKRRAPRSRTDAILDRHVGEFTHWLNVRQVAPTIEAIYRRLEALAAEELAWAKMKLASHDDKEADTEILRRALRRTIRRILHPLAANLRRRAADQTARAHLAAVRELFELDTEDKQQRSDQDKS